MGWTSYHATNYKNGKIDRKAEVNKNFNHDACEVLKSSLVGTTVYSALKYLKTGEIFATVTLTKTDMKNYYSNFYYKMMDETEEPYYYDCPASILNILTPTDDENANRWREKCRENQKQKKKERQNPNSLNNLPIGSIIECKSNGKTYTLIKHPASYQFKRPFWMVDGEFKYISTKYIPKDYKVISTGKNNKKGEYIYERNSTDC